MPADAVLNASLVPADALQEAYPEKTLILYQITLTLNGEEFVLPAAAEITLNTGNIAGENFALIRVSDAAEINASYTNTDEGISALSFVTDVLGRFALLYDAATEAADEETDPEAEEPDETPLFAPTDIVVDHMDPTGVRVTVTFGALPEGIDPGSVTVGVQSLSVAAMTDLTSILGEGEQVIKAYDITLYANGVEFEPVAAVSVTLPVPAIADDEQLNVYHIDDNSTVEQISDVSLEGSNCQFRADSFSLYIITRSSSGEEGTKDGGDGPIYDGDSLTENMTIAAEYFYGPNAGEHEAPQVTIYAVTNPTNGIKAGDELSFKIAYTTAAAEQYRGGGFDKDPALYNSYDDVRLKFKMPPGLKIMSFGSRFDIDNDFEITGNEQSGYTYTLKQEKAFTLACGEIGEFSFTVYVMGNGTDKAIRDFDLANYFELSFVLNIPIYSSKDVVDHTLHYNKEVVESGQNFTTIPDDSAWGVEKIATTHTIPANAEPGDPITLSWTIRVGMLDSNDHVITNNQQYSNIGGAVRKGIVPITSATLIDTYFDAVVTKDSDGSTVISSVSPEKVIINKAGESSSVVVTNGSTIPLNDEFNHMGLNYNASVDSDGVLAVRETPVATYTDYNVTATYLLTEEMIADFSENTHYVLTGKNKADSTVNYYNNIKGPDQDSTAEVPNGEELPFTVPADLQITKRLTRVSTGATGKYNDVYGPIAYTLTADEPFIVYEYTDGQYKPLNDMEPATSVTIDDDTLYYLAPGIAYNVNEALSQAQGPYMQFVSNSAETMTPADNDHWRPDIINRETLGSIEIHKQDDSGKDIADAEFELLNANNEKIDSTSPVGNKTGNFGLLKWENLPYGTYTLREISPAAGYAMGDTTEWTFTINENKEYKLTGDNSIVNKKTSSIITLTKYVGSTGTNYSLANTSYTGTFVLQRTVDGETWEPVDTQINGQAVASTVNGSGQISANVPAFAENGATYTYRFEETMPAGYYDPTNSNTETTNSAEVTLVENGKAKSDPTPVTMYNRQLMRVNVYKNYYTWRADQDAGQRQRAESNTKTANVSLYRYLGTDTSTLEQVEEIKAASGTAASWLNLPLFRRDAQGNETKYQYLVAEEDIEGYILYQVTTGAANGTKLQKEEIDGQAYYKIAIPNNSTATTYTARFYNFKNIIPIHVVKRNSYTNNPSITGCEITVYEEDKTTIAKSALDGTTDLSGVTLPTGTTGAIFYLEPGKVYYYEETKTADHYAFDAEASGAEDDRFIKLDLSDITEATISNVSSNFRNTYFAGSDVKNKPDPMIRINKYEGSQIGIDTSKTVTGAEFTLYTMDEDGAYQPVLDDNNDPVKISTNKNSNVRVEPGTYYVAETTVPQDYLNPNSAAMAALYGSDYVYDADTNLTYIEITVDDQPKQGTADNIQVFEFKNIPNKAGLQVKKYLNNELAGGFNIKVTGSDESTYVKTTDDNGVASFTGLPVYTADGSLITYTISEELEETLYYRVSGDQSVQLTLGSIVTVDEDNNELAVYNETKVTISANKAFFHTWDYNYTHRTYPMGGATIGLFAKNGDGVWERIAVAVSDDSGRVSFSDLTQGKEYKIVELACTDSTMFPHNSGFKQYPAGGADTTLIPDGEIDNYGVLTVPADAELTATEGQFGFEAGTLLNADHWVQFDITKWLDPVPSRDLPASEGIPEGATLVDNAIFELYRIKVPAGVTNVTYPGSGWELIDVYSTGSKYVDSNGEIKVQPGEFMTDVDQGVDETYVYLLIETNPGPTSGAVINPYYRYTYYQAGSAYNITVNAEGGENARSGHYTIDRVNEDDILNSSNEGPGESKIYLGTLRIAKWMDSLNSDTGEFNKDYQPLPNVKFKVSMGGRDGFISLTTGLDIGESGVSSAQSATYQLLIEGDKYYLLDYENVGGAVDSIDVTSLVQPFSFTQNGQPYDGYRIPMTLKEVSAPEGYSYITAPYNFYFCFVDTKPDETTGNVWVFNDAYYVLTSGTGATEKLAASQSGTAWYIRSADDTGLVAGDGQSPLRIVDYPLSNTMVWVYKYGYTPNAETKGLISKALDAKSTDSISREPITGAQLQIEKKDTDGTYKPWNFRLNAFGTTAQASFDVGNDGGFMFPDGLEKGDYRIKETSLPDGYYRNTYEMAYDGTGDHYRYFTVTNAMQTVTMYNPKKPTLKFTKTDMAGNPVKGLQFSINYNGKTVSLTDTDEDGQAALDNFESGKYGAFAENKAGLSKAFLKDYLEKYYGLGDLTTSAGMWLGYSYSVDASASGTRVEDGVEYTVVDKDVVISDIIPATDDDEDFNAINVTIKNPTLGNITLEKTTENGGTPLQGASFAVYGWLFPTDYIQNASNTAEVTPLLNGTTINTGWTRVGGSNFTTNAQGKIDVNALKNLEPGVYAVYETSAPSGYDVLKDTDDNAIVYYVVLTGGLPVEVTGLPASVNVDHMVDPVKTLYTDSEGISVTIAATNREKVKIKAAKQVENGMLPENIEWDITLNIYDSADATTAIANARITNSTNQTNAVYFKSGSSDAYFSQNTEYYLEELIAAPTLYPMTIDSVKLIKTIPGADGGDPTTDEDTLIAGENGRYAFTVDGLSDLTISVVNDYLRGTARFAKYASEDITKNINLSGGAFEVRIFDSEADDWVPVPGATVTEEEVNGKGTGIYFADIPLISKDATVYRIYETKAPDHYYVNGEEIPGAYVLDTTIYKEFTLSCAENVAELQPFDETNDLVNTKGYVITIKKWNNIYGSYNQAVYSDHAGQVTFSVYHLENDAWKKVKECDIDGAGVATYLTEPRDMYAIEETYFNGNDFLGFDSMYMDNVRLTPLLINVEGTERYAYVFNMADIKQDITVDAFNKPYMKPEIRKRDNGGYPASVMPRMAFSIYDLSTITTEYTVTDAFVDGIVSSMTPVFTGRTTQNGSDEESKYSWARWESSDAAKRWDYTRTYLLVETQVYPDDSADGYDTLRKDDTRVYWYHVIEPVEDPNPAATYAYTLYNVYGDAEVSIKKKVEIVDENGDKTEFKEGDDPIDSLLLSGVELFYTIEPGIESHNQALSSYVVEDTGLNFTPVAASGPLPSYKINSITVGKASHNTANLEYEIASNAKVQAQITFHINGQPDSLSEPKPVSDGPQTFTVPENTRSFSVSYFSDEVLNGTNELYALGEDFDLDPITVEVSVNKLPKGSVEEPVSEPELIENTASVVLTYPKWKDDGSGTTKVSVDDDANVIIPIDSIELPVVEIVKTASTDVPRIGRPFYYTITIKNISDVPFNDPIVIDMMPTGIVYNEGCRVEVKEGTATFASVSVRQIIGNTTTPIEGGEGMDGSPETAVVIEMKGTMGPNSVVDIYLPAVAEESAKHYVKEDGHGNLVMTNYSFLTSSETSFHTVDNPNGYSFKKDQDSFPDPMQKVLEDTGEEVTIRESGLHPWLVDYEGAQFVYIEASANHTLNTKDAGNLVKAVWADQDTGYHPEEGFLGTATRYLNSTQTETGWVRWQLTATNGDDKPHSDYIFGDIIPKTTDGRNTKWDTIFDHIINVTKNKTHVADSCYRVYYYTDTGITETMLDNAIKALKNADELSGWTAQMPENKASITAIIVKFYGPNQPVLQPGDSLIVSYETSVKDYEDDEFINISYENANNSFFSTYDTFPLTVKSNEVSATILGGHVSIAGDLWIDEDWDATQEDANRRDYSQYAIVQQLIEAFSISMTDNRYNSNVIDREVTDLTDNNESVYHFQFNGLSPALNNATPLYFDTNDPAIAHLNVRALKGTKPANYTMNASFSTALWNAGIFTLTQYGSNHYVSDDPNTITAASPNAHDSNFMPASAANSSFTRPFFILFTENIDKSKDIGVRMQRGLEITKVAADDATVKVGGASFSVYGPFEEDKGTAASGSPLRFTLENGVYVLDDNGSETVLTTNANGTLKIDGLNWWKEYVIKELEAAQGYDLADGVTYTPDSTGSVGTVIDKIDETTFVLKLPAETKTEKFDKVTVTNKRKVEVVLNLEKLLNTYAPFAFTFKFDLDLEKTGLNETLKALNSEVLAEDPIQTLELTVYGGMNVDGKARAYGSFDPVVLYGAGTYTFTITELSDTNPDYDTEDPAENPITYDTEAKTVKVTVVWSEDEQQLVVSKIEYTDSDEFDAQTYELIENTYTSVTDTSVKKVWDDKDNQDGKRPDSVTAQLMKNNVIVGSTAEVEIYTEKQESIGDVTIKLPGDDTEYAVTYVWDEDEERYIVTVNDLPKYDKDGLIVWSWIETIETEGYSMSGLVTDYENEDYEGGITTITNSYTPGRYCLTVLKVWDDKGDAYGFRPDEITVQLYKMVDGEPIGPLSVSTSVTKVDGDYVASEPATDIVLSEENNWTAVILGVDKYEDGQLVQYYWKEVTDVSENGYSLDTADAEEIDGEYYIPANEASTRVGSVKNSYEPEQVEITVLKIWEDEDNVDGIRPDHIDVKLLADGEFVKTLRLDAEGEWKHTEKGLAKYKDGEEIEYSIEEYEIEGYEIEVGELIKDEEKEDVYTVKVTNMHEPETIKVTVIKVWDDAEDQDGVRPESIQVTLYADGEAVGEAVELKESDWKYSWEDLAKYAEGKEGVEIVYTAEEAEVEGYEPTYGEITEVGEGVFEIEITNTHEPETTEVTVLKVWDDDDDNDGKRPGSITITLKGDGSEVATAILSDENSWTYTWTELPVNEDGEEIEYTVEESKIAEYTLAELAEGEEPEEGKQYSSIVKNSDGTYSFTLVNAHEPILTETEVTKIWVDSENQKVARPETIKLTLLANNAQYAAFEIGPDYEDEDKDEYKTTFTEDGDTWNLKVENLPKYVDGVEQTYSWIEEIPEGYTISEFTVSEDGATTIKNTYDPERMCLTVLKVWDDDTDSAGFRPDDIKVTLSAKATVDSEKTEITVTDASGAEIKKEYTLSEENSWSAIVTGLPIYYEEEEIEYSWSEELEDGSVYELEITKDETGRITYLTNSYEPEQVEITVLKIWEDEDNVDGIRPDHIDVKLLADGEFVKTLRLDAEGEWKHTEKGLAKYKDGEEIEYSIEEYEIEGYEIEVGELIKDEEKEDVYTVKVTNMHEPETIKVTVIKVWDDAEDQDGVRPESIQVTLYADGEAVGEAVELKESDWKYSWEDLAKYAEGKEGVEIVYTAEEAEVEGYEPTYGEITEVGEGVFEIEITNTHEPETTEVTVLKVWDDDDDNDGKRPGSITITLKGDGSEVATAILSDENSWTYTWTELPVNEDGEEIEYTVEESKIAEYTLAELAEGEEPEEGKQYSSIVKNSDGTYSFTLVNAHEPILTETEVTKIWVDEDNKAGQRPGTITVKLIKNNETDAPVKTVTLLYTGTDEDITVIDTGDDNKWAVKVVNLPAYEDGDLISYSWIEVTDGLAELNYSMSGLEITEEDGIVTAEITNTYDTQKYCLTVMKVWDDANDQDRIRPDEITVRLYKLDSAGEPEEVAFATEVGGEAKKGAVLNEANNWTVIALGVEKYQVNAEGDAAEEIKYYWTEEGADGYELITAQVTIEGESYVTANETTTRLTALTNKYEPELTEVTVLKVWDDADDQDGLRAESVTVELLADGKPVDEAALSETNSWTYTFEELAKNADGVAIVYTVREINVPEGYTVTIRQAESEQGEPVENSFVVTNSHEPELIEVSVTKLWDDAEDQDGIRPDTLYLTLLADGEEVGEYLLSADDWTVTVDELPRFDQGKEIVYTWDEKDVPEGYELTDNTTEGYITTVTNKHEPETTEVGVKKVWDDNDDFHAKRPESIVMILYADGETVTSVTLNEQNSWTQTVSGLMVNKPGEQGKKIAYTWDEANVPEGYQKTGIELDEETAVTTITNTYLTGVLEITKSFEGYPEDAPLEDLSFTITGPNWEEPQTVTYADFNGGKYTIDDLVPGQYTVVETNAFELITDYTLDVVASTINGAATVTAENTDDAPATIELKNVYIEDYGTLIIKKAFCGAPKTDTPWSDEAKNLTFTVVRVDESGNEMTDADGNPLYKEVFTFEDLVDSIDDESGNLVRMKTIENLKPGLYKVTESNADFIIIDYTLNTETSIMEDTVKVVKDGEATAVLKNNYKKDQGTLVIIKTVSKNVEGNPQLDNLAFRITGVTDPAFELTVTYGDFTEGQNGAKYYEATVPVGEYKVEELNANTVLDDYTLVAEDSTTSHAGLIVLKNDSTDAALEDIYQENEGQMVIIKSFIGVEEERDGIKDAEKNLHFTIAGPSFLEPITISYADFENGRYALPNNTYKSLFVGSYTVTEVLTDADGLLTEFNYTYDVTGSTTSGSAVVTDDGSTAVIHLTNKYDLHFGSLTIEKVFAGTPDGADLDSLNFHIEGPEGFSRDVSYGSFTNGKYTITGLRDGTYTVTETNAGKLIAGYQLLTSDSVTSAKGTVGHAGDASVLLKNVYEQKLGTLIIEKIFNHPDAADFSDLTFQIDGPDGYSNTITYGAFENGAYVLENLVIGDYTIYETNAPFVAVNLRLNENSVTAVRATVAYGETTVAPLDNRYTIIGTNASVMKIWNDMDNLGGIRPASLTATLLANGEPIQTVELNEGNGWTAEVTGLVAYRGEKPIAYTWTEETVPGYTLTSQTSMGNATVFVNTHNPALTSTSVVKVWDDNNDANHTRPVSVRVKLSNGSNYTLNAANNWSVTVNNLPKYNASGTEIVYAWSEQTVIGYAQTDKRTVGSTTIFVNSYRPPYTPGRPPYNPDIIIEEPQTPLAIDVEINHTGNCFD